MSRQPRALILSAHLDDAAFSCGGTMARLARQGIDTVLATVFTASIAEPTGFALACQLDKGLAADVDYLELRRGEDAAFARSIGAHPVEWLGLPEAPHRGYESAADLFGPPHSADPVRPKIVALLDALMGRHEPDLVFAPQGVGGHVDHVQLLRAVVDRPDIAARTVWYRDLPYAARRPEAPPSADLPSDLIEHGLALDPAELEAKLVGAACYPTQIGFQFGDVTTLRRVLTDFARLEAQRLHQGNAAESVRTTPGVARRLTKWTPTPTPSPS